MQEVIFMSKSYKKYPKVKQERLTKKDKRHLNKRIRHLYLEECFNGADYKKLVPNYNTWQYRWSWREALKDYNDGLFNSHFSTLSDFRNYYENCVKRK